MITAEGAPVSIGADTVVMENAVLKASGGTAMQFPCAIGERCIVGPHAYVVGAHDRDGCFIAAGPRFSTERRSKKDVSVALGAIVHVKTRLPTGSTCSMQHIAFGDPATIYPPDASREVARADGLLSDRFQPGARGRRTGACRRNVREIPAQNARARFNAREHKSVKPPPRRSGEEPPQTQATQTSIRWST